MSWFTELWKGKEEPTVGLCLSGGGARGVVHIGLLKALEEHKVPIHAVSGTSMGAIVAVMHASGMKSDDMLEAFINLHIESRISKFELLRTVFSKGLGGLYERLHETVGVCNFEELKIPCSLTASDVKGGQPVIFTSGDAIHAALASATIPIIFHPYEMDGKVFVDGGLFNNFPVDPLIASCSHIIGSHANHMGAVDEIDGTAALADRVFRLAIFQNVRYRMDLCDALIDPPKARSYGTLDFDKVKLKELFDIGYEAGCSEIDAIKDALKSESEKKGKRDKFTDIIQIEQLGMS
ncbi:patatin-like phospholipase family protein [Phaeocystidibacter luteus]|uniref:Patatin-like phospholipase family protein n=1 Tax=Phaeocystidibacter luteus TaxID=911197 RepID=A0A6N6RM64_9FLAO|nr:patatin-like phospholipase family protein [Phaeocystidibacter luteus]KAB2814653.1 patatin-like phospholipase family protein [Phaeocystidibacter luteus]